MNKIIILTGVPADAALLAQLNERMVADGHEPYKPKIDYTVMPCGECGAGIWIGPRQRAVHDAEGPENAPILCATHAHEMANRLGFASLGHLGGGDGASRT